MSPLHRTLALQGCPAKESYLRWPVGKGKCLHSLPSHAVSLPYFSGGGPGCVTVSLSYLLNSDGTLGLVHAGAPPSSSRSPPRKTLSKVTPLMGHARTGVCVMLLCLVALRPPD